MTEKKFYVLSADGDYKFKYLTNLVHGDVDIRKRCQVCGHFVEFDEAAYKNLVFEVSDNKEYPDCIMYGGSPNFLIISQAALDAFIAEKVSGFYPYPIKILEDGKEIDRQYYILRIYGKALYHYKKMGQKPSFYCEKCGYTSYKGKRPMNYEFTYLKEDSWDGSDLFLRKYCTEKVIEIIKKNKLIGFEADDILHSLNPYYIAGRKPL